LNLHIEQYFTQHTEIDYLSFNLYHRYVLIHRSAYTLLY